MAKSSKKTFIKLGYSPMETAEIVTLLNRLLSNYAMHQQKMKNYYWNLTGENFFNLQANFEKMLINAGEDMNKIAWRIRLFGQTPVSTFSEYLKHSTIKEEIGGEVTSFEMVKSSLEGIRILLENLEQGVSAAEDINDSGTLHLLQSLIYNLEKEHWMLTAWMKNLGKPSI